MKKSVKNRSVFCVVVGLTFVLIVLSFIFDVQIIKFIESLRNQYLDVYFLIIEFLSNVFIIFFFIICLFSWNKKTRRYVIPAGLTIFLSVIVAVTLKVVVKRLRPFQEGLVSVLNMLFYEGLGNFNTWNYSFPSFQTMLVFALVPLLNKKFRKFKYIWLIFAVSVGLSRMYFGVHYMSDVLSGGLIGYLIGMSMIWLEKRYGFGGKIVKRFRVFG
ncbi:phosphatase PAP2 family protein [archaeon]|jgi:undecaprenyl-diphosphatase|nr:phosphatase PAP2 family protein [archaeon]MBT4242186.1 phosphatase PAP2 family protein [archaeon]MBT4417874.1 phosphatase PAP2 family protein [archaeon]